MSAQPPPGYDPSVSKLVGAGESVPIIKMSGGSMESAMTGGGSSMEPPQNYIDGGYKESMLNGTAGNAPIERQSGGGDGITTHPSAQDDGVTPDPSIDNSEAEVEDDAESVQEGGGEGDSGEALLDQLQITEEEFADLGLSDLTFEDFTTKIKSCSGPQDLERADCTPVRDALKTIFINRLKSYIDECKGFTTGEGDVLSPELGAFAAGRGARDALPGKLIYDKEKGVWRTPKAYEDEGAALTPEKGQWVPKGDGTWVPAKVTAERGVPGSPSGPKYMKEFPKGKGTYVPAAQGEPGAVPVIPGQIWTKTVSKSVFGTKETWLPTETPEAAAKRVAAASAKEEAARSKSTEPLGQVGELLGEPYGPSEEYPSVQEAAENYAKIKVLFDLINFLPTIYKGIPQPNTEIYEYKTISELIRATAAIFANINPSMRTPERKKELETFKITTNFPNVTQTIGTRIIFDTDAQNRILGFITAHQDVLKITSKTAIGMIESIYTQLLNFIGDIGNITLYNRLHANAESEEDEYLVDSFAEKFFPKLTDPSFFRSKGKANYISIFYKNPNPISVPIDQYGTTLFAYRTGMPYVSKELLKDQIPVDLASLIELTAPIKVETFNFNYLMRRFFSSYGPIKPEDAKLFDLIHKDIKGFDMIFNLFVKHDANPFSSFADAATPPGKFAPDRTLDEHYSDSINRFIKLLSDRIMSDLVDPGAAGAPAAPLFGPNNTDIFSKLSAYLKDATVVLGFTFDQYIQGFDAIFNVLNDALITPPVGGSVSEESKAKYKTHLEDFMIICEYLTTFMNNRANTEVKKVMYNTIFGKIYTYYIRLYPDQANTNMALLVPLAPAAPVPARVPGPAITLSAKEVTKMQSYFKKVYSSSPYYLGNIFTFMMKRYLENIKNILTILPAGTAEITSAANLHGWLDHFRILIGTAGTPLNRICTGGVPAEVTNAFREITGNAPAPRRPAAGAPPPAPPGPLILTPEFITSFKRNPFEKKPFLEILFNHIKKNSDSDDSILTNADIKYINNIKDTLFMTKYTQAVKDIFYIHASMKKKYGVEYEYGHKPIDRFFKDAVIKDLTNPNKFNEYTFDVMMLLAQLNGNNKRNDEQIEIYNKSRLFVLQFMQPYLEQSLMDLSATVRELCEFIVANQVDIGRILVRRRRIRGVFIEEEGIINRPEFNRRIASARDKVAAMNDFIAIMNRGNTLSNTITGFINDNTTLNRITNVLTDLDNDYSVLIKTYDQIRTSFDKLRNYKSLFVPTTIAQIRSIIEILRNNFNLQRYNNPDIPNSEPILISFYRPTENEAEWTRSTWEKLRKNTSDQLFINYFTTMGIMYSKDILPPQNNLPFKILYDFFEPTIAFVTSEYIGEKPAKDDEADDVSDNDKLNAFEVSGLKFIEFPVDILYGAPDTPERKNFIELIIALLTKQLSLIFLDLRKAKERIKAFFYLLNQFEIVLYSIGEQENKNFAAFKVLFTIDSVNSFLKLAYEQYYKDTKLPGKDFNGFDTKKVIKAIASGMWEDYPIQKEIKTWFGGGSEDADSDIDINMKGGFFDPLSLSLLAVGFGATALLTKPGKRGAGAAVNWVSSLFGTKTTAAAPITSDMTIAQLAARPNEVIINAFKSTFYSNPSYLAEIQKVLLYKELGNANVKGMILKLNAMNTPIDILGPEFRNQYPNVSNFIGSGPTFNWINFDTYIQGLFPTLQNNKYDDGFLGRIGNFLFGDAPGDETTKKFKKGDTEQFILSLNAVISKFTAHFKAKVREYNNEIRKIEKQIFDTRQTDPTEGREVAISLLQDKIADLRVKKQAASLNLVSLKDIYNDVFTKMKNIMTSPFSNLQFPPKDPDAGPPNFFDVPSLPPEDPKVAPNLRIGMKDRLWKNYALDAIMFLKNAYVELTKNNPNQAKLINFGAEDPIFTLKGEARENAIKLRFNKLEYNFKDNNILNIDKDLSIFVNTWGKLIAGEGPIDALLPDADAPKSFFSNLKPRTNNIDAYFISLNSFRVYKNTKQNADNARELVIQYVRFIKAIFNHFKELVCILGDADVQKNELLAQFSNNAIVTYMKLNPINIQKKEKKVALTKEEKNGVGDKLAKCFNLFLSSPDQSQYGELFSVLYYITTNPQNAKLKKAFDAKKDKFATAYRVLKAYCDLDEDFIPPPSYGLPTVYIPGPPPQRIRYKMFEQPEMDVKEYTMTGISNQEFIGNRQAFNLLYDSLYSRKKYYDRNIKSINDRKNKTAATNVKFPKVEQIETGTRDELKFLASVLYSYGLKARTEILAKIPDGKPEKHMVEKFAGYSFTGGEGLDFTDEDIKQTAAKIDITRLDIQAPPYMFLTPEQRTFACERVMRKIHELDYGQVLKLLITLLGSYELQAIDKDDIVHEVNKKMVVKPITDIDAEKLALLRTASLVVRYDGLASNFVRDGVEYKIKGILQVPENYTCYLNGRYGKIAPVKAFSDIEDLALRRELELEEADVSAILSAAEENPVEDPLFAAANTGLAEAGDAAAPNAGIVIEGGGSDSFVVRNRTRSGSNSQYRLTASRKHVNREHNKHTRKNK